MTKLEEIYAYLKEHGYAKGEPEFVKVLSPVSDKEGWIVELVWMHHDGDIGDARFNNASLDKALDEMMKYLVSRDGSDNEYG